MARIRDGLYGFVPNQRESPTMVADFLLNWVANNINADAFRMGRTEARRLAASLVAAAAARGISKTDLETAAEESLSSFLYMAMEDVAALEACFASPQSA
jgi:hypothetical protein